MDSLKFPLKFDSTGVQKLAEGSDDYYAQMLTIAMLTEPFTLPFNPRFGVFDPSFQTVDKGLFVLNAARFVPEIEVTDLTVIADSGGTVNAKFSFIVKDTQ